MTFEIIEERDATVAVALHGPIAGLDIAPPADPLRHHLGANCYSRRVLFDLSDVPYLDSMAVSWLVTCHRRFRDGRGMLVLHSLHPSVVSIIRILRLDSILCIVPDAPSAAAVVAGENS